MATLAFTVSGKPVAKERPRTVAVRDRHGRHVETRTFIPRATTQYEEKVAWCAKASQGRTKLHPPFALEVRCFFPDRRRRDVDNVIKVCMDALNGVVWDDDSEVTRMTASKAIDRDNPRLEVEIKGGV